VSDQIKNKIKSRFLQLYVNSGISTFPTKQTLFSLKLQDGLKYLDAPSLSHESVLINNLNFYLTHRILKRLDPEVLGEIRSRTSIHGKSDVPPSEEAYLRGYAGLALKAMIHDDLTARIFYNYRITNFEDFDLFDRNGHELGLKADVRLLPDSTLSLQYSREKMQFNRWNSGKILRNDIMDDITLCLQLYTFFLLDITYSYQDNGSSVDEYSYKGNRFTIMLAKSLPKGIMFQLYALARSRKHGSLTNDSASAQIDLEDDERDMLMVKVSKDINDHCTLEVQDEFRRNRSREENGLYTKNVFSISLLFDF